MRRLAPARELVYLYENRLKNAQETFNENRLIKVYLGINRVEHQLHYTSCNLCLAEKMCIVNADKRLLLIKKSELISKCRHQNKFYVNNIKILST